MDAIRSFQQATAAGRRTVGMDVCNTIHCRWLSLLAVLSVAMYSGPGHAAYPAGVAGPDDISALRTPWYYIKGYPSGEACFRSEQGAMASVLAWAATLGATCSVTYTGTDPWPVDPGAGAGTTVSYCADTAGAEFGPLPDISDQNAKPQYHQGSIFHWDRVVTNSVCPADPYTYHESYHIDRYAYDYCPAGYRFYYSSQPGSGSFCRRSAEPERDQDEQCGPAVALSAGNPIYLGTGRIYQREADYVDARDDRFTLERHYDSSGIGNPAYPRMGMFGARWSSSFERSIGNAASVPLKTVSVHRANGERYYFNHINGVWVSNSAVREQLVQTPTGWMYVTAQDVSEHYDPSGRLNSMVFPDGVTQSLVYDAAGRLSQVQTTTGESLTFGYRVNHTPDLVESVTDHAGRVWRYRYNDQYSTLDYVIYPDGTPADVSDNPRRRYHYEDSAFSEALTGITDERGVRFSSYAYDTRGRAVSSYLGNDISRVDVDYNGADDYSDGIAARTVTNSHGVDSVYTTRLQNGVALLQDLSGPGCATCTAGDSNYRYDPSTNVLLEKTVQGVTTEYGNYDVNGNPGFIIEAVDTAEERRTDFSYDPRYFSRVAMRRESSVLSGAEKVTTYGYDDFGNLVSVTIDGYTQAGIPVSRTMTYQYDGPLHQLSRIDGPRTDVIDITSLRYYPDDPAEAHNRARLREIEDATGSLVRSNIHYSATGKILSEDRANGVSLGYSYYSGSDRLESLSESGATSSRVTRWTYLATGEVASVTAAAGTAAATTLMFGYDSARRLTRITDGLGNSIEYRLDGEGNRIGEAIYDDSGLLRKNLAISFDLYSRMDVTSHANETMDYDYAPNGTLIRQINGEGGVTDFSYDSLKRLLARTADLGGLDAGTQYGYDVSDNLVSVTDPVNGVTRYTYDDLGNRLEVHSPDSGMTIYGYDAAGNMTSRLDARNQSVFYHYDAMNRLISLDAPGSADDISYIYDNCVNGSGRLCSVAMAGSLVTYAYDDFGNVTDHQLIAYAYDAADRLVSVTYPGGSTVRYQYDAAGRVAQVDLVNDGVTTSLASSIKHAPFGPVESLTYGNGKILTQNLDMAYRLAMQSIPGVLEFGYPTYDGTGNLLARTDIYTSDSHFTYDALTRLETGTGPFGSRLYGYDLIGNRTSMLAGSVIAAYAYQPGSNRILSETGWTYSQDANGNTTDRFDASGTGEGRRFWYNGHNRLSSVSDRMLVATGKGKKQTVSMVDVPLASYAYNGLGQRISKTDANGAVTGYLYDTKGILMAELDEAGTVKREYVYLDGQLLAVLDPLTGPGNQGDATIVDNGNPPVGWASTTSKKDYGTNYLYSAGGSGNTVRWIPSLVAGAYDIYVWYVHNRKNSKQVPYAISHGGQLSSVLVDQSINGGSWQLIAQNITFEGLGGEYIEVSDVNGRTTADAIRLVNVGTGPSSARVVSYVHNDHLGTPQVMTDETGAAVWRATYDPFGKATIDTTSIKSLNVRFPGQYFDRETGLHYNYFRYYEPNLGRYITSDPRGQLLDFSDPVRQVSATTGISMPQGKAFGYLNHSYAYVDNNPVNRIDPTGEIDPVIAGLFIWGFLYASHIGDKISQLNGNVWGEPQDQDQVCTLPPPIGFIANQCVLTRCQRHDICYEEYQCTASSWVSSVLGGTKSCNLCNSGIFQ